MVGRKYREALTGTKLSVVLAYTLVQEKTEPENHLVGVIDVFGRDLQMALCVAYLKYCC